MTTKAQTEQKRAQEVRDSLNAPTPSEAIKTRKNYGAKKGEDKELRYIDARYVMERLDAAVGPFGWTDTYREVDGGVVCTISISLDGEVWVPKSDVGTPSKIEGVKGRYSDAFKRAAVKWGIGRDLYEDASLPAPEPVQEVVEAKPASAVGGNGGLSPKQKGLLFGSLKDAGLEGGRRKAAVHHITGKQSVKNMDGDDLDGVLHFLKEGRDTENEIYQAIWRKIDEVSEDKVESD